MYPKKETRNCSRDSLVRKSGAETVTMDNVVKSSSNLCPQLVMSSTGFTSEMSPLGVWPSSTNVVCRLFSSHHDHGMKMVREDNAQTSGSSFEFLVLATEEGLKQFAIAPQLELVPRSPEVVDVVVNCVHKPVRIPVLDSSGMHSRICGRGYPQLFSCPHNSPPCTRSSQPCLRANLSSSFSSECVSYVKAVILYLLGVQLSSFIWHSHRNSLVFSSDASLALCLDLRSVLCPLLSTSLLLPLIKACLRAMSCFNCAARSSDFFNSQFQTAFLSVASVNKCFV